MHALSSSFAVAVVALLASTGCASTPKPAAVAATGATGAAATPVTPKTVPNTDTASGVHIDDKIRKACGISDDDAYFAYDSANLGAGDRRVLGLVATCFERGPLAGQALRLVGHADPRGPEDYNVVLGMRRAQSVEGYLVRDGLDKAKVDTSSRGALDAQGSDESGWAKDRRVDMLAP
jgi:outer membrane protein OmpA-like peptidoglycan-associated protein